MSRRWRFLALAIELDDDELRAVLLGAERADDLAVERDGRRTLVWVWRGSRSAPGARRLGAVWLRHGTGGATIEQIAWDPGPGDEARLWARFERLTPSLARRG